MPLIDGPDCRLFVEVLGDGDPVAVFAHGVTGSTFDLEPLAARTPGTRVLFDLRGHGRSEAPETGYAADDYRRDLDAVAGRYGAARAFGLSAGAVAVAGLLAEDPVRFERAVLMLPAALDRPAAADGFTPLLGLLERFGVEEAAARALEAPEQAPLFAARPYWRALVAQRIRRMNTTGVPRAIRAFAASAPLPYPEGLRAVRAPVLVIAHRGDPLHDDAVARRLVKLMPNSELALFDEPLAMYDDPDALAGLIGRFLAGSIPGSDLSG